MAMSTNIRELTNKLISFTTTDQSGNFPVYIDGVQLPPNAKFSVSLDDLYEEAWRDNMGFLHSDLIRKNVRKVSITWGKLAGEDVKGILQTTDKQFMELSYPCDPLTGNRHTITCYASAKDISELETYKGFPVWQSLSFNLIER